MNKLGIHTTTLKNISVADADTPTTAVAVEKSRRLIILIPPELECASLTRRICKLANETNSDVLLLGLYKDATQELALQREVITASALIWDVKIYVETKVEMGTDWLTAVKRNYQAGDMIVCIADQSVGIRKKPLSQILESTFKAPIYILTNAKPPQVSSGLLSQILAWSGLLVIVAVFFVLQVQIVRIPDDWPKTVLSILILIPELASILFWNSLF